MFVERADFWDLLPINSVTFGKVGLPNVSQMAGGDFFAVRKGSVLWSASVTVSDSRVKDADALRAVASDIHQNGKVFAAGVPHRADLGALVASVSGVSGDKVKVGGLASGAELRAGDWFSYETPTGGRMLHRLRQSGVVGGLGVSDWLAFEPDPAPIDFSGVVVDFGAPEFLARIVPGSLNEGASVPGIVSGLSFKLVQVIK